ncbi:MAG: P-loop NTPase, partial [Bacteroidota bacterium]|nr:P-loop NTPase [Bacteroidota bacterium]
MNENDVLKALSKVQEPDLKRDLVTLNMVKDILIKNNAVSFTIILTTPACPLKDKIKNDCIEAIKQVDDSIKITVNFTSNTTSIRTDKKDILTGVKNIIAVVSGKGGVGKSTVASNLAIAIAEGGAKVGLMDADIYGPSVHIMFGVRGERPLMRTVAGKGMIVPLERYGIKLMSIGLLVDEQYMHRCLQLAELGA